MAIDIGAYATALAEDRRDNPRDDLTTALVGAEVDGEQLTSAEIASFFILLAVAGNETTRNAIGHGVLALPIPSNGRSGGTTSERTARPPSRRSCDGRRRWSTCAGPRLRDVGSAAWRSPGDKVTMWYCSANRDERHFADPWLFDVARTPNHHVGFGGGGTHFCLGANLARREISVVFEEIHSRIPDITVTEGAGHAALGVHPRHQETAGQLDPIGLMAGIRIACTG